MTTPAQEIIVQLWRSFAGFDERVRFSTWLYSIALNVAISFYRRESVRTRHVVPGSEHLLEAIDETENYSEEVGLALSMDRRARSAPQGAGDSLPGREQLSGDRRHPGNQRDQRRNEDQPPEAGHEAEKGTTTWNSMSSGKSGSSTT